MTDAPRILVAGASGVFGRLLATELLERTQARVVLGARDTARLADVAATLPHSQRTEIRRLDLTDSDHALLACADCVAVACLAGPFQSLDAALPGRIAERGIHWVDIADDESWVLGLLGHSGRGGPVSAPQAVVVPGASVSPALSGVLARLAAASLPDTKRLRLTLFIGNRNSKGQGAVDSALASGFSQPATVDLPGGPRKAYRFASPDAVLLAEELHCDAEFRVVFELKPANWIVAAAQPFARRLGPVGRGRLARMLRAGSRIVANAGSDAGVVQAEAFDERGSRAYAALVGAGQRLAILPAFVILQDLLEDSRRSGCFSPATWLEPLAWVERLEALGIEYVSGGGRV